MSRDWKVQLEDIHQAISKIRSYLASTEYAVFAGDSRTQDAVIRNLGIIGEAARSLPEHIRMLAPEIEWRKMIGLRNLLVHEYFGISIQIVWDIVSNKLDDLDKACMRLVRECQVDDSK